MASESLDEIDTADGCDDATVLAVCCSPDDSVVKSLMKLRERPATPAVAR